MSDRIARAERAQQELEFVTPLLSGLREEYLRKINAEAIGELHPVTRSDKITTLSVALRVIDVINNGLADLIRDGEIATREKLKAENIAQMSDAQQRLLRIVGV